MLGRAMFRRISSSRKRLLVAVLIALISATSGFSVASLILSVTSERDKLSHQLEEFCTWPLHPLSIDNSEYVSKAVQFLTRNQFDSQLNLTREGTSGGRERTYWLLSDNLLASKALQPYNATVSTRIWNAMVKYGFAKNGLHESLFGCVIPIPPVASTTENLTATSSYTVKVELHNSTQRFSDFREYGDLLVYVALRSQWLGNRPDAEANFEKAVMMWDGKGIRDKAFTGEYQTYKLALILYASRILNIPLQQEQEMRDRMWAMQRADGGLWTGYNADLQPSSVDVNTETTALAILAGA